MLQKVQVLWMGQRRTAKACPESPGQATPPLKMSEFYFIFILQFRKYVVAALGLLRKRNSPKLVVRVRYRNCSADKSEQFSLYVNTVWPNVEAETLLVQ